MCKVCEQVKKATGQDMSEEDAIAYATEQAEKMEAMTAPLAAEVVDFVNAMREKYGHGTFPPLMNMMALIIGSTIGKIPDQETLGEAAMGIFSEINKGVNISMAFSQKESGVDPSDFRAAAFNVTIAIATPQELREMMARDQEEARVKAKINSAFQVKAPILH